MWTCVPKLYSKDLQPRPLQEAGSQPPAEAQIRFLCSAPRPCRGGVQSAPRAVEGKATLGASAPRQEWPRAPATRLFQATLPGRKEAPTPALPGVEGPGGPQITAIRHQTTTCRSFSALLATLPNVPGQFHPETLSDLPQPHSSDGASLGIWVCSAPEPGCSPLPRKDSLALVSAPNHLRM